MSKKLNNKYGLEAKINAKDCLCNANGGSSPVGNNILCTIYGVSSKLLDRKNKLYSIAKQGLIQEGYNLLPGKINYHFNPQGVTLLIGISESGLEIHTWPEHKTAAITFYTCRSQYAGIETINHIFNELNPKKIIQLDLTPVVVNPNYKIKEKNDGRLHFRNIIIPETISTDFFKDFVEYSIKLNHKKI